MGSCQGKGRIFYETDKKTRPRSGCSKWTLSGGVYMRKLAPARVHTDVDKMHVWFKSRTLRMRYPFQSTGKPISHRNGWSFSCLHDTVARFRTGVKFSPWYKNRGGLTPGWLAPAWNLWWYHVSKYRAMRGNRSGVAPGRKSPRCHVNNPSDGQLWDHTRFQTKIGKVYTRFQTKWPKPYPVGRHIMIYLYVLSKGVTPGGFKRELTILSLLWIV